jgi:hypothetical protein
VQLSDLGPFFALQERTDSRSWRPLRDLYDASVLDKRVAYVSGFLEKLAGSPVETRVAASTMSLGLFARLIAPPLGSVVLERPLPAITLDEALWQPTDGGPWQLALTGPEAPADPARVITETILPLAELISSRYSLSLQILIGNIASGAFGAIRMIGQARHDLAGPAQEVGRDLLSESLQGTGTLKPDFRRSSCCLYYRIPGGGYCGDCVLTAAEPKLS